MQGIGTEEVAVLLNLSWERRQRLRTLVLLAGGVAALVGGYLLLCALGLSVACPVYALTGLLCPGCGVTRMLQALVQLDLVTAWQVQPMILLSLPPLALLLGDWAQRYVRTGMVDTARWHRWLLVTLLVLLITFTVLRNLPGLECLRPMD